MVTHKVNHPYCIPAYIPMVFSIQIDHDQWHPRCHLYYYIVRGCAALSQRLARGRRARQCPSPPSSPHKTLWSPTCSTWTSTRRPSTPSNSNPRPRGEGVKKGIRVTLEATAAQGKYLVCCSTESSAKKLLRLLLRLLPLKEDVWLVIAFENIARKLLRLV